jgi:hypothetical protein
MPRYQILLQILAQNKEKVASSGLAKYDPGRYGVLAEDKKMGSRSAAPLDCGWLHAALLGAAK